MLADLDNWIKYFYLFAFWNDRLGCIHDREVHLSWEKTASFFTKYSIFDQSKQLVL